MYNLLSRTVRTSLAEWLAAVDGLFVMSPAQIQLGIDLANQAVPEAWRANSFVSNKRLGAYTADLLRRHMLTHHGVFSRCCLHGRRMPWGG